MAGIEMDRRSFLKGTAGGIAGATASKDLSISHSAGIDVPPRQAVDDPRDGGIFGHWMRDEFGLPAFRYEMDHVRDPRAIWDTIVFGKSNRHWHQLGNDRITAVAANEGWIQLYSPEFGPRWINMYRPDRRSYAGGVSFVQVGHRMLSTLYRCLPREVLAERTWGCSYTRFKVEHEGVRLERTVFAPFGDCPFLVAHIRLTNVAQSAQTLTHIEYWDLHLHNIDYNYVTPWAPDKAARDRISARYTGYACAWDEMLGALIARHPMGPATSDPSLNWPGPTASNRPDISLKPLGFNPDRQVTERRAFFDDVTQYLPNFIESAPPSQAGAKQSASEVWTFLGGTVSGPAEFSEQPVFASLSKHTLGPGESVVLGYAYGATPASETESELGALDSSVERMFGASLQAWQRFLPSVDLGDQSLSRELAWSSYYVRSGAVYHRGFNAHTLPQGGSYQYMSGGNAGPRATLQHALSMIWLAPELVKEVLRFTLAETHPSGEIPDAEVGTGLVENSLWIPSDNDLWLLWVVSEYILSTRDRQFLAEVCSYWPPPYTRPEPVWDHCVRAFRHLTEDIGYGPHGLLKVRLGDWNDGIVFEGHVPFDRVWAEGETTLTSAMAVNVLRRFAELARYAHRRSMAERALEHADKLREAVRACWRGRHLNRGWRDRNNEVGYKDLYLEPQPRALIADILDENQRNTLVDEITSRLADPVGSKIFDSGGEGNPMSLFGGEWLSINSTLVWGLSKVSPERAWKELLANTLFHHARTYRKIWFGIWSGPDMYLNASSDRPGEAYVVPHESGSQTWPVQILFAHSETLNSSLWMMGIEATAEGIAVRPRLPFERWSWSGSGLSLSYDEARIQGSISGAAPELITLELQLPRDWHDGPIEIEEGGVRRKLERAGSSARLRVRVAPHQLTEFTVKKA